MTSQAILPSSILTGSDDWFDRPMRWAQFTLAENDPVGSMMSMSGWIFQTGQMRRRLSQRGWVCGLLSFQNSLSLCDPFYGRPGLLRRTV